MVEIYPCKKLKNIKDEKYKLYFGHSDRTGAYDKWLSERV